MPRLPAEPEGAAEYYEMMGRVIAGWGRFEGSLTNDIDFLMQISPVAKKLAKGVNLVQATALAALLHSCFEEIPELKRFELRAGEFRNEVEVSADNRNMVAHGHFWGFVSTDPVVARFRKQKLAKGGDIETKLAAYSLEQMRDMAVQADNLNSRLLALTSAFRFLG